MTYENIMGNLKLSNIKYEYDEMNFFRDNKVTATSKSAYLTVDYKLGFLEGQEDISLADDDFETSEIKSIIAKCLIEQFGDDDIE